jgi:hypothetical protein
MNVIALRHGLVEIGNARRFSRRPDHARPGAGFQAGDRGDMIAMMVGDENVGQPPSRLIQRLEDGRFLAGIDGGRGPCGGIVDQDTEIIGSGQELSDLRRHHSTFGQAVSHSTAEPGRPEPPALANPRACPCRARRA